jgi:hypothetical protein
VPRGPFPDSSLRTVHATFTAHGSPGPGFTCPRLLPGSSPPSPFAPYPELLLDRRLSGRGYLGSGGIQPLPPFALWPAFPTPDYYGGTDAFPGFTGGLSPPFQERPLTFLIVDSARLFRRRLLSRTQAALCGIPNAARLSRWPSGAVGLGGPVHGSPDEARRRLGFVRRPPQCFVSATQGRGLLSFGQPGAGVTFPVGPNTLQVDSPCNLSVKPRLLAACVGPHGYISGAAFSPRAIIRQQLRPKDSLPACTGVEVLVRRPFPHSTITLRDAPCRGNIPVGYCWQNSRYCQSAPRIAIQLHRRPRVARERESSAAGPAGKAAYHETPSCRRGTDSYFPSPGVRATRTPSPAKRRNSP